MGKQGQGVSCQPLHTSIHPRLWEYEALEGHIQVGTHPVRVGKRADAAHCMACKGIYLLRTEHLCLGVEHGFELGIVDLGVPCGHNQHTALVHQEGEGLGDPGGDDAGGLGGQLHCGAGGLKFQDILLTA